MSILIVINVLATISTSVIIIYLAVKFLQLWFKYREELLFHLSTLFIYIGIIMLVFGYVLATGARLVIVHSQLGIIGAFYGLFYLEYSLFYLSLFSNSKNVIEKYFTVVIGMTIILNFITIFIQIEEIVQLTFAINIVTILSGIYLVGQTFRKLKKSEQYLRNKNNIEYIQLTQKISLMAFITLIIDGIGFMSLWIWDYVITDIILIIIPGLFVLFAILTYYLSQLLIKKGQACDMTTLLNNL